MRLRLRGQRSSSQRVDCWMCKKNQMQWVFSRRVFSTSSLMSRSLSSGAHSRDPLAYRATLATSESAHRNCGDAALTKTEALQERWCLGVLHRLLLVLEGLVRARPVPVRFALPGTFAAISLGPDLRSRIVHRPDPSVLFRGLDLCRGILHNLYRGSLLYRGGLHGLYGLDLCPCIFLGRPGFEFLQQGFSLLADRSRLDF